MKYPSFICDKPLFLPNGQSQNLSGVALPTITLNRQNGAQNRYLLAKRGSYTGVKTYDYRTDQAKRLTAIAGTGDDYKELRYRWQRPNYKHLSYLCASENNAKRAAQREWGKLEMK
ncbi:hypothetical protein [Celerinatantimonas diazotrophica]|uniref:hypothetical protein n=1 Tax=Celerinatantimonas diazotrophica TaxID=412034 RepID=UPI001044402C|nr:hypothetical protein [Celerinatantimonas diazotrophica]CAG9297077.1 hypothetical protein CEDIAZO_02239 [Celerinatantimonas diazotrophica]